MIRKLSSYVAKSDIRSYKTNEPGNLQEQAPDILPDQDNMVVVDTSKYVKETSKWNNLLTYSRRFGVNAKGWSLQYYGYNLKNTSNWSLPVLVGIERFEIDPDYFSQFNYQSATMSYFQAGISPFYKMSDHFFLNLGVNLIVGDEVLTDFYGRESSHTFFGISPSQGIFFIPKSKVGITFGVSVYEKLQSSKVYKNDLGIKFEFGIKF